MICAGSDGRDYFWQHREFDINRPVTFIDWLNDTEFLETKHGDPILHMVGAGNKIICFFMEVCNEE